MPRLIVVLLLAAVALLAESSAYLILQRGASSGAYYSLDGKLETTIPVAPHPHEMALSTDGRFLYTTCDGAQKTEHPGLGGNGISVIDINARKRIADISLGEFRRPHGIDVDPSTGNLAVT